MDSLLLFSLSKRGRDSLGRRSLHREDKYPFFRNVDEGRMRKIWLNL